MDQLVLYGVNSARDVEQGGRVERSRTKWRPTCGGSWSSARSRCGGRVGRRYPVLIAIDDYNALHDYSLFEYQNRP